jgi:hypothetical protein
LQIQKGGHMEDESDKEQMLTPLYLIEFQGGTSSPEINNLLVKWGLIEKKSRRSPRLSLTLKGLKKALESSIVLSDEERG